MRQECFLPEMRSPFGRVMAKQRQSAFPAAVMLLAEPHWHAKFPAMCRALLPANSRVMRRMLLPANSQAPLEANSRAIRRVLFQAISRAQTADWRPPLLGLPLKAKLLVPQPAKPQRLEAQD